MNNCSCSVHVHFFLFMFMFSVHFFRVHVHFFNKPSKVNLGYIVMNNKAMYNQGGGTVHFELHPSEETQLVNKILKLAGIAIQQPDIMTAGQGMDMATIQQQPKI